MRSIVYDDLLEFAMNRPARRRDRLFLTETVPPNDQCPRCHEERMDYLVWQDDDVVQCHTCGCEYTLDDRDPMAPNYEAMEE